MNFSICMLSTLILFFTSTAVVGQDFLLLDNYPKYEEIRNSYLRKSLTGKDIDEINKIIKSADKVLKSKLPSVTYKTTIPASGDKHDYFSLAPYFWPDSTKKNGLPWIRKDGEVNPMTRVGDQVEKETFFKAMKSLKWAYFFTQNKIYSDHANKILNSWFIDPNLKMNPNLNFGQAVPGENNGRPAGMIEWSGFGGVLHAVQMFDKMGVLSKSNKDGINIWLLQYIDWLKTNPISIKEDKAGNNHGTWYDNHVIDILLYLNKVDEAKQRLNTITKQRIVNQIAIDGSMPEELKRTKTYNYTVMNTQAFINLAVIGNRFGIPLYEYKSANSNSIKSSVHFLKPYIKEQKWPYKQIAQIETSKAVNIIQKSAEYFDDKDLQAFIAKNQLPQTSITQILN
jgi:hypothetical protein